MKRSICLLTLLLVMTGMRAQVVRQFAFEGTLDGKIPVRLAFEENADSIVAGAIYYPKAKKPAQILVVGNHSYSGIYNLSEYQEDGVITGTMSFTAEGGTMTGDWYNPRTEKIMAFTDMHSIAFPKSFGGKLTPEDPGKIGHEYKYSFYHTGYQDMMGGTVTFRAAGKNRVHFHVSNVPGNIAEGESEKGRPALLHGNEFEYYDVNECGYGFKAAFFPRFVVLTTLTDWDSTGCFGAFTTFEEIYIKVKD